jgi:hypothetical protein
LFIYIFKLKVFIFSKCFRDFTEKNKRHFFRIFPEILDKYIETQQDTIILIVKKPKRGLVIDNSSFVLHFNNFTVFADQPNIDRFTELYKDSKTLSQLGFKVSVGTVVWNQCKDILTDDATQTRLIYSSDINNNTLTMKQYTNAEKKNYIKKTGVKRSLIVINRGYGVGEYKFNYCLIDIDKDYLIENHLICIEYTAEDAPREVLIDKYNKVITSLKDKRTQEFIDVYFGNNAINTTEMNNVLPIYNM